MDKRNHTVSLCMIVKNEQRYLRECLESVQKLVDEIIIIDTGSTDDTVNIAKEFDAIIDYFEWNDNFSDARNKSLSLATKDWIFVIDADECLKIEDQAPLIDALNDDSFDGYFLRQLNLFKEDSVDEADVTLTRRIFKNNQNFYYQRAFHEVIAPIDQQRLEEGFKEIEVTLLHKGYLKPVLKEKDKLNRNIQILEKMVQEDPEDVMALFKLANEYNQNGNYEQAQRLFQLYMNKVGLGTQSH